MNNELLNKMKKCKRDCAKTYNGLIESYNEAKTQSASKEELEAKRVLIVETRKKYDDVVYDIKSYLELEGIYRTLLEEQLAEKYSVKIKPAQFEKIDVEEDEVIGKENNKNLTTKIIAGALGVAGIAGIAYGVSSCNANNNSADYVAEQENQDEEYGSFKDASDAQQVNERVDWYFDNYINKEYGQMTDTQKDSVSKENLADIIQVLNGVEPEGFEVNEVINYDNRMTQMFSAYLSTADRENIGFIPTQYLYEDGSHEQKCAAELDEIMEPLIAAINAKDDEAFKKYATEFGLLMKDQYYLVDNTAEHYNVRSIASYPSRIHLYSMAYAFYTESIMEYGLERGIDVCIPFCVDYNTKETVQYPLSKLMATLEFVPMGQWDAVIQRSGLSVEQLKALGNQDVEDVMPYEFTQDAKNHFRENRLTLK